VNSTATAFEYATTAAADQSPLVTPDDDPFYEPPPGYAEAEPGTVLRSRDVRIGFFGVIGQRVAATQLLYRTTNLHGDAEVAVTTVLLPAQRDPELDCPVLSYQCAIDAVSSRCFPPTRCV
jgi:triacylglycerol lipase